MKVVVDATMLDGGPSGAATRLAALGHAHLRAGRMEFTYLVRPGLDPLPGLACLPCPGTDTPMGRWRAGPRIEELVREAGAALFLAGALPLPRLRSVPIALTLHDLRILQADAVQGLGRRLWGRHVLRRNLSRARLVVAVSDYTRDGLVDGGLRSRESVAVVPNAATPGLERVHDVQRLADFRRRADVAGRYVLGLGPVEAHKQVETMLAVLTAVRSHEQGADLSLVLAGRTDARRAFALGRQAERWGVADALRMVGPLDALELAAALSGADALLVTGRHEGFSIPLVDAQQCGVPVVAVRSGALAEVGGDGVWLAGPEDVPGLAAAVLDATTPSDLCESRLRRGRKLAARWSWETSARALEAALENCVQG